MVLNFVDQYEDNLELGDTSNVLQEVIIEAHQLINLNNFKEALDVLENYHV